MQNAAPPVTMVILRPLRLFTKPAKMEKKAPAVSSLGFSADWAAKNRVREKCHVKTVTWVLSVQAIKGGSRASKHVNPPERKRVEVKACSFWLSKEQ